VSYHENFSHNDGYRNGPELIRLSIDQVIDSLYNFNTVTHWMSSRTHQAELEKNMGSDSGRSRDFKL
jgi:hypothetical protein